GRPFFGGTYFPPDDVWGRPGFKRVLNGIATAYREKHGEVLESADSVMGAVAHQEAFAGRSGTVNPKTIDNIVASALQQFDPHHGGFRPGHHSLGRRMVERPRARRLLRLTGRRLFNGR